MAKDLDKDLQDAVNHTSGRGFAQKENQPKQKTKTKTSAIATANDSLQGKAASAAKRLSEVDQAAQSAVIKKAFADGQKMAQTETMAETAGYLGAKAQLTAMATSQRIGGVEKIRQDSDKAIAAEIDVLEVEGGDTDPLELLSGYTGTNHGLLLPSPFA